MSYFGKPVEGSTPALTGAVSANIADLQNQINQKANILSPILTGVPQSVTPALFDSTTKIATTQFVQRAIGGFSGVLPISGNTLLTSQHANFTIESVQSTGTALIVTIPVGSTMPVGSTLTFFNLGYIDFQVTTQGSDFLWSASIVSSITVQKGDSLVLLCRGGTEWDILSGSAALRFSPNTWVTTQAVNNSSNRIASTAFVISQAATTTPGNSSATGAVGVGTTFARSDHAHPTDTTRAPIASPVFTGTTNASHGLVSPQIELGPSNVATTPFIDFHSSGQPTDFDSRIIATGGNSSTGMGALYVVANTLHLPTNSYGATRGRGSSDTSLATTAFVADAFFPAGTRLLFQQSSAPTGWVKDTGLHDRALRITAGNVTHGGYLGFAATFSNTGVGSTSLSAGQMPWHNHTGTTVGTLTHGVTGSDCLEEGIGSPNYTLSSVGFTGSSLGHGHGLDLSIAYTDVIIATKQ